MFPDYAPQPGHVFCATEEIEETAKLYLRLQGAATRFLPPDQVAALEAKFPS